MCVRYYSADVLIVVIKNDENFALNYLEYCYKIIDDVDNYPANFPLIEAAFFGL